jgi:hypothetical protein
MEAVHGRLNGWQGALLSPGGREIIVKSVMSAMMLHFMQALMIPAGVIKHIDRIRKGFLWRGNEATTGLTCRMNWDKVCALKVNEAMEILDLKIQNKALMLKWVWKLKSGQESLCQSTVQMIYGVGDLRHIPNSQSSHFIKSLIPHISFCETSCLEMIKIECFLEEERIREHNIFSINS